MAIDFTQGGFSVGDSWQLFSAATYGGHFSSVTASGAYGNLTFNFLNGKWTATGGSLAAGQSLLFFENNTYKTGNQYAVGQLALVPEPSAFVIAGIGLCLIGAHRLRQRGRSARKQALTSC